MSDCKSCEHHRYVEPGYQKCDLELPRYKPGDCLDYKPVIYWPKKEKDSGG